MAIEIQSTVEKHGFILMRHGHRLTRVAHYMRYGAGHPEPWRLYVSELARLRLSCWSPNVAIAKVRGEFTNVWTGTNDCVDGIRTVKVEVSRNG